MIMLHKALLGIVVALSIAPAAQAATYDAFASFDGTQGAGGFVYFALPPNGGAVQLTQSVNCVIPNTSCLEGGGALPGAYKSPTVFDHLSFTMPNDRLLIHPGQGAGIGVFFIAPTAGTYNYDASFNIVDRSPTGVSVFGLTNASGAPTTIGTGFLNQWGQTYGLTGSVALDAGEFIIMGLNAAGSFSNDSTGFNFVVTTGVPEPASWALMITGLGLAGAAIRRRAAAVRLA
jgi:hypothetical protein